MDVQRERDPPEEAWSQSPQSNMGAPSAPTPEGEHLGEGRSPGARDNTEGLAPVPEDEEMPRNTAERRYNPLDDVPEQVRHNLGVRRRVASSVTSEQSQEPQSEASASSSEHRSERTGTGASTNSTRQLGASHMRPWEEREDRQENGRVRQLAREYEDWSRERSRSPREEREEVPEELLQVWFEEMEWGGEDAACLRNGDTSFMVKASGNKVTTKPLERLDVDEVLASHSNKISVKKLSEAERRLFDIADAKEWQAILGTKGVEVISVDEAKKIRQRYPDRIITSRMVRRWKKQEGTNSADIAKSRWCVHGFKDPDTGKLCVFSPTPQTQSMMLFLQVTASLDMQLEVADVKNAFCQGRPMKRPWRDIYVEPCAGLGLPAGISCSHENGLRLLPSPASPALSWHSCSNGVQRRDLPGKRRAVSVRAADGTVGARTRMRC